MASLLQQARRLTFWLAGTPDDTPPPVPIPEQITPLLDHVAFFLNLRGTLPPEMTREEIMDYVDKSVSDRQLQAHAMAFLRDYHGMQFDPKLNPTAPPPKYYSSADRLTTAVTTVTTGAAAEEAGSHVVEKPFFETTSISAPLAAALIVSSGQKAETEKSRTAPQAVEEDKEKTKETASAAKETASAEKEAAAAEKESASAEKESASAEKESAPAGKETEAKEESAQEIA